MGRRILIADDNQNALAGIAHVLRELGHDVSTAVNGLDALRQAPAYRPDVVILDLGMPEMDGLEAGRRLRREFGPALLLIALTGWGQDFHREWTCEAGFDVHLVKPLDIDQLTFILSVNAGVSSGMHSEQSAEQSTEASAEPNAESNSALNSALNSDTN
jgi:CheY-like chemotaxis protein